MLLQLYRKIVDLIPDTVPVQVLAQKSLHYDVVQIVAATAIRVLFAIWSVNWRRYFELIPLTSGAIRLAKIREFATQYDCIYDYSGLVGFLTSQRAHPAHQAKLRGVEDPKNVIYQHERVISFNDTHVDSEQRSYDHGEAVRRAK